MSYRRDYDKHRKRSRDRHRSGHDRSHGVATTTWFDHDDDGANTNTTSITATSNNSSTSKNNRSYHNNNPSSLSQQQATTTAAAAAIAAPRRAPLPPSAPRLQVPSALPLEITTIVDQFALLVARGGLAFEDEIKQREANNPFFHFLFAPWNDPVCAYYRWRVYSLLNGDTIKTWATEPFQMVQGDDEIVWIPPPMPQLVSLLSRPAAAAAGAGKNLMDTRSGIGSSSSTPILSSPMAMMATQERAGAGGGILGSAPTVLGTHPLQQHQQQQTDRNENNTSKSRTDAKKQISITSKEELRVDRFVPVITPSGINIRALFQLHLAATNTFFIPLVKDDRARFRSLLRQALPTTTATNKSNSNNKIIEECMVFAIQHEQQSDDVGLQYLDSLYSLRRTRKKENEQQTEQEQNREMTIGYDDDVVDLPRVLGHLFVLNDVMLNIRSPAAAPGTAKNYERTFLIIVPYVLDFIISVVLNLNIPRCGAVVKAANHTTYERGGGDDANDVESIHCAISSLSQKDIAVEVVLQPGTDEHSLLLWLQLCVLLWHERDALGIRLTNLLRENYGFLLNVV